MSNKTHKGLSKRLKRTASGKLSRRHMGKRHLMSGKSPDRKRRLRKTTQLAECDQRCFERQFGII
jgi:large subunit ribosomal protein L35